MKPKKLIIKTVSQKYSILIGPNGKIKTFYDKINMFDVVVSRKEQHKESKVYTAGKKLVSTKLPWGNLGLTICYDLRFPELYRKLSKKNLHFSLLRNHLK